MKRKTLNKLNEEDGLFLTDKGIIHNYLSVYEKLFSPLRDREINIFEVGYQYGGSCRLWEKYFPLAHIKAIDIKSKATEEEIGAAAVYKIKTDIKTGSRVSMEIRNIMDLDTTYFKNFPLDIAIDDGSHKIEDQVHFIKIAYPALREGGILIIEDISDIWAKKKIFKDIHIPFEIISNRYFYTEHEDNVLVIFRK